MLSPEAFGLSLPHERDNSGAARRAFSLAEASGA